MTIKIKTSAKDKPKECISEHAAAGLDAPRWNPAIGDDGRVKYRSLVDSIRSAILSGDLVDDERLPTQRVLAARLGINVATVTKAIAEAGRLGLVVTRVGGGTHVVATRKAPSVAVANNAGIIDLSINIPPMALVRPLLDDVLVTLARRRRGGDMFDYALLGGSERDRNAGVSWVATRGLQAVVGQLLVTQGAHEGLFAALSAAAKPGDVVLCEDLNYTGIRRLSQLCQINLVGVTTDGAGMQPKALAEALVKHSPAAIVCTPVTLNPTTASQDIDVRRAIIGLAKKHAVTVIEDDIYGYLAGDGTPPLAALWPEGVIYVCGLSKSVAPGLRLGYLLAPERFINRIGDALGLLSWTAPSLHAAVATELINSGIAEACARLHHDEARKRMDLAYGILGDALVVGPSATYHGWLQLPPAWRDHDAAAVLRQEGILVSPAKHFLVGDMDPPSAVRISLGAAPDIGLLEGALWRITEVLERQPTTIESIV